MNWITILISMLMSQPQPPVKLIYVGDPMCSWCYGFAPELEKVISHYEGVIECELVNGGLRPYNTETMTDLKGFLTDHWNDVNKATGQPFSYEILERSDLTYDTEPPSRAVAIFRSVYPEQVFDFFKEVQKAFYFKNMNPHDVELYEEILQENGWKVENFRKMFQAEDWKINIKKDFARASKLGVRSFPTVLLEVDGEVTVVAQGYASANSIIKKVDQLLDK